jgi:hypothetical protein
MVDSIVAQVDDAKSELTKRGVAIADDLIDRWIDDGVLSWKQIEVLIAILHCGWYRNNFVDLGKPSKLYIIWDGKPAVFHDGYDYFYCKIGRSENPKRRIKEFKTSLPDAEILYVHHIHSRMERMVHEVIDDEWPPVILHHNAEWFMFATGMFDVSDDRLQFTSHAIEAFDELVDGLYRDYVDASGVR